MSNKWLLKDQFHLLDGSKFWTKWMYGQEVNVIHQLCVQDSGYSFP